MKISDLPQNFSVLIPSGVGLASHLLILWMFGLDVAGQHAHLMASASILAVAMLWRADIFLLAERESRSEELFRVGLISITVVTLVLLCISVSNVKELDNFIRIDYILCGSSLAINEIVAAWYLRRSKEIAFVIIKSSPFFFFFLALLGGFEDIVLVWSFSLLLAPAVFVYEPFFQAGSSKPVVGQVVQFWRRTPSFVFEASPFMATSIFSVVAGNIWLIVLFHIYGAELAGLWANAFRIVALPVFTLVTYLQYSTFTKISQLRESGKRAADVPLIIWRLIEVRLVLVVIVLTAILFLLARSKYSDYYDSFMWAFFALPIGVVLRAFSQYLGAAFPAASIGRKAMFFFFAEIVAIMAMTLLSRHDPAQDFFLMGLCGLIIYVSFRSYLSRVSQLTDGVS